MEERVKTSFIPKASLQTERKQVKPAGQFALVNIVAGVILVVAILAAAGVYAFQQFTIQSIAAKQASLERSREAFEPATIKQLSRVNTRIETGKMLLATHTALSKLFDELEKLMLSTVRFSDFAYTSGAADSVALSAHGEAASFNSVALQSNNFSKSAIVTDPIFSNVNITKLNTIGFDFNAVIDASKIVYSGATAAVATPELPAASSSPQQPAH